MGGSADGKHCRGKEGGGHLRRSWGGEKLKKKGCVGKENQQDSP